MLIHLSWPKLSSSSSSSLRILSFPPPLRYSFINQPLQTYRTAISSTPTRAARMGHEKSQLISQKSHALANFRLCNVSGRKTELVEIHARDPKFHVLFIPGNPGVVSFYTDFLESLYEQMGETASITAIGHISHSEKDWEHGKLFGLKEQIDHKINFIQQELQPLQVPLIVVGHSIGSYMSLEVYKKIPEKVAYFIGLYPFLAVDTESQPQSIIKKLSRSHLASSMASATVALFGFLPNQASKYIAKISLGKSWSITALDALCTSVLKYHTMRNVLYMVMTEFEELDKVPDWEFMREKQNRIAFLYGEDDHWAPLHMHDEIVKQQVKASIAGWMHLGYSPTSWRSGFRFLLGVGILISVGIFLVGLLGGLKHIMETCIAQNMWRHSISRFQKKIVKQVPDAIVEVEKEGHTHAFSCTITGSKWVARHVATLINKTLN